MEPRKGISPVMNSGPFNSALNTKMPAARAMLAALDMSSNSPPGQSGQRQQRDGEAGGVLERQSESKRNFMSTRRRQRQYESHGIAPQPHFPACRPGAPGWIPRLLNQQRFAGPQPLLRPKRIAALPLDL